MDLNVYGPADGDYIQVEVSLEDIGNSEAIDIWVQNIDHLCDHIEDGFAYSLVNNDVVDIDGDD